MAIHDEINTRLTTFAGLTALVSTRSFPVTLPASPTYPAVTYARVGIIEGNFGSTERPAGMGPSYGLTQTRFRFDAFSDQSGFTGYDEAQDIIAQIKLALDPWTTSSGTIVQAAFFANEGPDLFDSAGSIYQATVEYVIHYEE